ncbi:MAG: hypothetical protein EOM59_08015 [Clostridia bacterium]|nr:hypothetical protein [Clostridia bacterium]
MNSIKAYQHNVDQKEGFFAIEELIQTESQCRERGLKHVLGTIIVILKETIFYPEGGGQPCDLGTIEGKPVIDVFEDKEKEIIYHRISCESTCDVFCCKELVHCQLDWERRFTHMQMHSAEHLVSGLIWELFGGINKGFHMNQEYATIDILLPDHKSFSEEMIDALERRANQAIWENTSIHTEYCASKEEAETHPLRKSLAFDEDISVVLIGLKEKIYDCCACCGTHVKSTGQLGLIKIVKTENYKGMTRVTLKAGLPAFNDAALRHKATTILCNRYSTEIETLIDRVTIQETKNGAIRKELYDLKKLLLEEEKEKLRTNIHEQPGNESSSIYVERYDKYSSDDLQNLARSLGEDLPFLVALVSQKESTAILASSGQPSCGDLVKEYAPIYQGKGGGSPKLARAIFNRAENLEVFLDLIEKHLR